jgi:TetR/AcrR family tetracycline transcriptional repressor
VRTGGAIDRAAIVEAALRLVDETGLDGLTLRRLAAELGVRAPALYWHVRNKRELLDAMAERLVAQMLPDSMREPAPGQPWWEWMAERSRALRRAMLARRDGARIMIGNRPEPGALPGVERMVTVLVDAGLDPLEALRALLAVSAYTMGWVAEEQAGRRRALQASADEFAVTDDTLKADMRDPKRYPLIAAAGQAAQADGGVGGCGGDPAFTFGLEMMIDGLRHRAEHHQAEQHQTEQHRPERHQAEQHRPERHRAT